MSRSILVRATVLVTFAFAALCACSEGVMANPIPADMFARTPASAIFLLFIVNLPVDLFAYSMTLAAVLRMPGLRIGRVSPDLGKFIGSVVGASACVAAVGAVIDFFFLFERVETQYSVRYDYVFEVVPAMAGALLVFASILLVSVLVVRTSWLTGLGPAAVLAVANPLSWYSFTLWANTDTMHIWYWLSLVFFAALGVPVLLLIRWHRGRVVPS